MPVVADRLRGRIRARGPIPFAEFMEEALYGEAGYYRRVGARIGEEGDFITGSSYSHLFGRATARLMQRLDRLLGRPADYLEVGFGSGRHLRRLREALADESERRMLACDRVPNAVPAAVEEIENLAQLEPRSLRGLVFSYELFDALPVHRLIGRADGGIGELWVDASRDAFHYVEGALSHSELALLVGEGTHLAPGQIADLAPGWRPLYRQMAGVLEQGLLVTCDYGFERHRLLDRRVHWHGTLACYRRQRVHRNALQAVGEQDLTAHVDFTALREEGEQSGLETVAFTRQAHWLLACGLFDQLQGADQATRLEAMTLLDPAGMGEEIRVLVQTRGIDIGELLDLQLLGASPNGPSEGSSVS